MYRVAIGIGGGGIHIYNRTNRTNEKGEGVRTPRSQSSTLAFLRLRESFVYYACDTGERISKQLGYM